MAKITFKGNEVNTNGSLPAVGAEAPVSGTPFVN